MAAMSVSSSKVGSARKCGNDTATRGLRLDSEKVRSKAARSNISERRARPRSDTKPSTIPSCSPCKETTAIERSENVSSDNSSSWPEELAMRTSSYANSELALKRTGTSEKIPIAASIFPRSICSAMSIQLAGRITRSTSGASRLNRARRFGTITVVTKSLTAMVKRLVDSRGTVEMADPSSLKAGSDWPAYGGSYSARRYSPLDEINSMNVAKLTKVWTFHTGDLPTKNTKGTYGAENTPLKVGDKLYVCTPKNIVIAVDAKTGKADLAI